jgi:hypothetical protein
MAHVAILIRRNANRSRAVASVARPLPAVHIPLFRRRGRKYDVQAALRGAGAGPGVGPLQSPLPRSSDGVAIGLVFNAVRRGVPSNLCTSSADIPCLRSTALRSAWAKLRVAPGREAWAAAGGIHASDGDRAATKTRTGRVLVRAVKRISAASDRGSSATRARFSGP